MRTIVVTTTGPLWEEAQKTGEYTHSTIGSKLEDVGFIHATSPGQIAAMLNRHFADRDDILLLLVDVDRVKPEVKFESPLSGRAGLFPHIYGPLNVDAVYDTIQAKKDASGHFIEPAEVRHPAQ